MTEQERSLKMDELLKKLEELIKLKLIAGAGLNITKLHDGEFLIEQASDTRYEALAERLLELEDRLDTIKAIRSDDSFLNISERGGQLQISVDETEFEDRVRYIVSAGRSTSESEEFHPFKVVKVSSASVRILGYNPEEKRFFRNMVIGGTLPVVEVPEQTFSIFPYSGYLYLTVSRNGSSFSTAIELYNSPKQGTDSSFYVPLAYITVQSNKIIDIQQIQKGAVFISGRVI